MVPVYALATNITSALGMDTAAHWQRVLSGKTGIQYHEDASFSKQPFWGSKLDVAQWQRLHTMLKPTEPLSPFEQICVYSVREALQHCQFPMDARDTVLILSTTKGNIEWLGEVQDQRTLLSTSGAHIAKQLGLPNKPIIISHACVSGIVALQYAMRVLQKGRYKHAIVVGADRFSRFVLSGFQSFQAVADDACKPFDANRKGINLGEAAATIILSTGPTELAHARLVSGATSNDANHISGPSRTGEELSMAIDKALQSAGIWPSQVDMISAHGTATVYNDEMEAKAFNLSKLQDKDVHSFKGYVGHTLGAAGVLESVMCIEAIRHQQMIPSLGFTESGVSCPLNITRMVRPAHINYVLKTASGFGGSNATAIWAKV